MDDNFDNVSWQNEQDNDVSKSDTGHEGYSVSHSGKRQVGVESSQAGENADRVDLAGIGDGRLDCKVDTPIKENDGTKDAYVSYLVTTQVGRAIMAH